ncbi:MAG: PAS domain S-box protein [Patescibacteria group bacterium]|nr:PAS domain S-box protein [Patescibacteria group bacterium]
MRSKVKSAKPLAPGKPRAKTREDLASFEHTCRRVFRVIKDGVLLVNAKTGSIEESNPSLLKILGCTKKELLKRKIWSIGFLDGPLSSQAAFGRLKRGHQVSYEHLQILTKRRQRLGVNLEYAFYRAGDIEVVQFNIRDITERRRLETALQEREERYRKIFDNSQLGIAIISLDLRISKINQAFTRITGYDETDMKRLALTDITHPSHLSAEKKILRGLRNCANGDYHVEQRYIGKRGNVVWANTHISAVCDKDGKPMYFQTIIEDITERKQMEAELEEQNLRSIEKEKTIQKLKDEFIFIAAHELRTPVTAIGWAMELLKEGQEKSGVKTSESTEIMDILVENTKRLNNLVAELLEVSRIEYGTFKVVPEKFDLATVIDRAVLSVKPLAKEKAVSVKVIPVSAGFPEAFADPIRVYEVLTNLLTNAIKYNKSGGNATVRANEGKTELQVSVEDTGFGLNAEDIPKLFHRFSRIESDETAKIGGTGLGLFIVKQVVERMGGSVLVASPGRGQGATFTFSLPKAK